MFSRIRKLFIPLALLTTVSFGHSMCKNHPSSGQWPTANEWQALNQSLHGALLPGVAPASSCYEGNPLGSGVECKEVSENWFYSSFHGKQPASIGYSFWANNSCVAPVDYAFDETKPCDLGGLPQYILNATSAAQIAVAAKWASSRDIRIVVKGTGHDLNGRSSGAYSLSIWTYHLRSLQFKDEWPRPLSNKTENVVVVGTGNTWGDLLAAANSVGRTVLSGQDGTVGLGGFIGGGGNGPLSSHYGLAADQILQATVVTTDGRILVANNVQNQDLLWAIRGGGPGLYGIVVEYVMRTFPRPKNVVIGSLSLSKTPNSTAEASWDGLTAFMRNLPDLMDLGVTGFAMATVKGSTTSVVNNDREVSATISLYTYNSTESDYLRLVGDFRERIMEAAEDGMLSIELSTPKVLPEYLSLFNALNPAESRCGEITLSSSRLLGRRELTELSHDTVKAYLKRISRSQVHGSQSTLIIGLQGGAGPRNVELDMRGALTPAWRDAYLHVLATGSNVETQGNTPKKALQEAAEWTEEHKEQVWREWAPDSGSYINEANPFNTNFKYDFYGGNYERLMQIKQKYDPYASLYVQSGVGSHAWEYNLDDGKLCRTA